MHIGNLRSGARFMGVTTKTLAAAAVTVGMASSAMAIPLFNGGNNLIGGAAGLDENLGPAHYLTPAGPATTAAAGSYTMPNGVTNAGGGAETPGMTESIRTVPAGDATDPFGDGIVGINIPQPADLAGLAGIDSRVGVNNPFTGNDTWGARSGAVTRWDTNNEDPPMGGTPKFLIPAGSVSGQIFNLTPQAPVAVSAALVDDGLAPGSMAGDGIADFIPFVLDFSGARVASYTLTFVGEDDTGFDWDGDGISPSLGTGFDPDDVVPDELIARKRDYEGGALANVSSPPLDEQYFGHDGGNDLSGTGDAPGANPAVTGATGDEIDDFVDGTLILGGRLLNSFAVLTWTETGVGTGNFLLDVNFFSDVIYDEGSLIDKNKVTSGSTGDINYQWDNIPFASFASADADGSGGIGLADVNAVITGGTDHNGGPDYDFTHSSSASQTFTANIIPEPLTSSLAVLGLAGLGAVTRRRRA